MFCLNDRAFEILLKEIDRCTAHNSLRQTQRELVLKRLQRLRTQKGRPVGVEQLRASILDMLPDFNPAVLQTAAKVNCPSRTGSLLNTGIIVLLGLAGIVYVANLPISLIRGPVSQHFPLLLLPSYMSMDYHYRQAVALVERADQLVNQATSAADLELGATKVTAAQQHLDNLPVWFLEPRYRSQFWWYGRYTIDEFRQARETIGRMEAKLFQEKNSQTLLTEGEQALEAAKQLYQQATERPQQTMALAQWQAALDKLAQIPNETLAGKQAQNRLAAYQRDLEQITGVAKDSSRSGNLVKAAKGFAMEAARAAQNPPHTTVKWEEIAKLWQTAIDRLNTVSADDPGYSEAQALLATYQSNLSITRVQLKTEEASMESLEEAQRLTQSLVASAANETDRLYLISRLQTITTQLRKVQPNTTAYPEAQQLLASAEQKLAALKGN